MTATATAPDDLFTVWVDGSAGPSRVRGRPTSATVGESWFALYGRISTEGYPDPVSSRRWQFEIAEFLTHGHGRIGVEFFDVGYSRTLSWQDRPAAADLLAEAARPDCRFDAVAIGEYERAFAGRQALQVIPYLHALGVTVWLPEFGAQVDLDNPTHRALFLLLGHQSEREVLRARWRTTRAMRTQVREQDRHLGGRPPYGYLLVDAGPHPNRVHARWGRRLHRLDPDPVTAPHVRWIFARRLAGDNAAGIARALNERNVLSPSAYDPDRNKHRAGTVWTLRTVAEILANPQYAGR